MKNLLIVIALFCIMSGTVEATEPQRTTMYVHPKNPHAGKGCRSNAGRVTFALYYTPIGGYTNHPQYAWHRPSYYVHPSYRIQRMQPKSRIIMSGDLPKYH